MTRASQILPPHAIHVLVRGRVQGVGYRYFAQEEAQALALSGWVRNCPDGQVEGFAEGPRARLEQWVERLKKGPPLSRVEQVSVDWQSPQNRHRSFSIIS
jgi:acylphosphatase